ncbi:MAG: hypothetical protein ACPMAQ_15715, partial [Phycisphaerae bacterium]
MSRGRHASLVIVAAFELVALSGQGCLGPSSSLSGDGAVYNNTTDASNGGAAYLGSAACRACHPEVDARQSLHGHAHMLNRIL